MKIFYWRLCTHRKGNEPSKMRVDIDMLAGPWESLEGKKRRSKYEKVRSKRCTWVPFQPLDLLYNQRKSLNSRNGQPSNHAFWW